MKTIWVTAWSHAYGLNIDVHPTHVAALQLQVNVMKRNPNVSNFTLCEKVIP